MRIFQLIDKTGRAAWVIREWHDDGSVSYMGMGASGRRPDAHSAYRAAAAAVVDRPSLRVHGDAESLRGFYRWLGDFMPDMKRPALFGGAKAHGAIGHGYCPVCRHHGTDCTGGTPDEVQAAWERVRVPFAVGGGGYVMCPRCESGFKGATVPAHTFNGKPCCEEPRREGDDHASYKA